MGKTANATKLLMAAIAAHTATACAPVGYTGTDLLDQERQETMAARVYREVEDRGDSIEGGWKTLSVYVEGSTRITIRSGEGKMTGCQLMLDDNGTEYLDNGLDNKVDSIRANGRGISDPIRHNEQYFGLLQKVHNALARQNNHAQLPSTKYRGNR